MRPLDNKQTQQIKHNEHTWGQNKLHAQKQTGHWHKKNIKQKEVNDENKFYGQSSDG